MKKHLSKLICVLFFNPSLSFANPEYINYSSCLSQSTAIPFSEIANALIEDVKSKNEGKKIITFFGFSSANFEDPQEVDNYVERLLEKECLTHEKCVILLGATDGIFRVAPIADKKGIPVNVITTDRGIDHFQCLPEELRRSVTNFYTVPVKEHGWIYSADGKKMISPITEALVRTADTIYVVGGGFIAIAEIQYALQQHKPVVYFPVKFSQQKLHTLAQNLASTNPIQIPISPYGFSFEYLMEVDPAQVMDLTLSLPEQWEKNPAYLALWEHLYPAQH